MAPKLKTSSIYFFRYDPVWKDKLSQWDRAPLVIPLEIYYNTHMLGVNIHWLPANIRMDFINGVFELTSAVEKLGKGRTRTVPRLLYEAVKRHPRFRIGLRAIRKYRLSNMSSVQELPPERWSELDPSKGKYKPRFYRR